MPVIGRLDSQVNDVLIEPIGGRRPRGERDRRDERNERDGRDERDSRSTNDDAPSAPTGEAARGEAHGGGARRDGQLPVWLL